jgi:hypothetical protein
MKYLFEFLSFLSGFVILVSVALLAMHYTSPV